MGRTMMPAADPTKPRFELKYVTSADVAEAFRERIADAMVADPHAVGGSYHVRSLYYDTTDLRAYVEKLDGVSNRFKIRLRWYTRSSGDPEAGPTSFLEAKHREDQRLGKTRVRLDDSTRMTLLDTPVLSPASLSPVDAEQQESAVVLRSLIGQAPLHPTCVVSYHREPHICRLDPTLRVTFDTGLRVLAPHAAAEAAIDDGDLFLPPELCVVEIKFHWAMPLWILEVTREIGLGLRRYSKYCSALERLHPNLTARSLRFQDSATS